jgi:transcriptional regulator with XRE-family HTH domain
MNAGVFNSSFAPTAGTTLEATLASHIRTARKRRAWTQSDLARESGVHLNTISQIERQEGDPRLSTLKALLTVLDINLAVMSHINPQPSQADPTQPDVPAFLRGANERVGE